MMKIIYIGPMEIPIPSKFGAVEEVIWQLARRLRRYYEVMVFNPLRSGTIRKSLSSLRVVVSGDGDVIVHSHNIYSSLTTASLIRGRHILTFHYPPWISRLRFKKELFADSLRLLARLGVAITAPSIHICEILRGGGIPCTYITNGVDIELFNPSKRNEEIRSKLGDGADTIITYVARITPSKNQLDLLKAFHLVVKECKSTKLILVGPIAGFTDNVNRGDVEYYKMLLGYIRKHGLEENVKFLSKVPRKNVAYILASSDIYVHPSRIEAAAPLAVLEAMASGLPIIAYELPYYKGVLRDSVNSILIKPNDYSIMGQAMCNIINDGSLRKRLVAGSLLTAEYFSWDRVAEKYRTFYSILLSSGSLWRS